MQIKTAKSKAATIRKKKRQKTTDNGMDFLHQMPSTTAAMHDRVGILRPIAVPASHRSTITLLLLPPPPVNGEAPPDTVVTSRNLPTHSSIKRRSFITLNNGLWLNDEVINYVARSIIQPVTQYMY